MSVSIIIPTLNERASIDALQSQLDALEGKADVLFSAVSYTHLTLPTTERV